MKKYQVKHSPKQIKRENHDEQKIPTEKKKLQEILENYWMIKIIYKEGKKEEKENQKKI